MDVRFTDITFDQALEILEGENYDGEIYIEPPNPTVLSDADSADEDEAGLPENLTGRQLSAPAELVVRTTADSSAVQDETSGSDVDPDSEDSSSVPNPELPTAKRGRGIRRMLRGRHVAIREAASPGDGDGLPQKSDRDIPHAVRSRRCNGAPQGGRDGARRKSRSSYKTTDQSKSSSDAGSWEKKDLPQGQGLGIFPQSDASVFRDLSPVEIFEKILNDELVEFLVTETNRYAIFVNCPSPNVCKEEMKVFLGILFLTGYVKLPSIRHYWEDCEDFHNDLVVNAMRRNRFLEIVRFIHCADNTQMNVTDKYWKLRPFVNMIRSRFLDLFVAEQNLDYDEAMVAYYGRHGCKQYIRGKPIRFGYKVWSLNTPNVFLVDFDLYQGKNPSGNTVYEDKYGKCAAPMMSMLDSLRENLKMLPFSLYFDNLFTGMNLLTDLNSSGYGGTGTVRENRLPKSCVLPSKKELVKQGRGSFDFRTNTKSGLTVARWMDNSAVMVASNCHGVFPTTNVNRFSHSEKKKIQVKRPFLLGQYSMYMGGTDRMDKNVSLYRIGFRGKKWWSCLFTWLLDVMMLNAWVLARKAGSQIPLLEFRRAIVQTYLTRYKTLPKFDRRPSFFRPDAANELRYDYIGHFVSYVPNNKRRRCQGDYCQTKARTQCVKCNVGLCIDCFLDYHIKK